MSVKAHCYPITPSGRTFESPIPSEARLLKLRDVALMLGVSVETVRRRVKDGSLPHLRISGHFYFRQNEIHAFLEAHRGNPAW